jgi:acyl dehydratase
VVPDPAFQGRVYTAAGPWLVTPEDLRAFARAAGATHPACFDRQAARALGYSDIVACPTYAVRPAQHAEAAYIDDPAAGIDFTRVVHAAQSFRHHQSITAGARLWTRLEVTKVVPRPALSLVTTVCAITDDSARPVCDVTSTLAIRGVAQ